MSVCRLMPLTIVLIVIGAADMRAQDTWPGQAGPIPGLVGAQGPIADNGVPQIGRAAPFPQAGGAQDPCAVGFQPLREEAQRRGQLIKDASVRHATPDEACRLIGSLAQAESSLIRFVESRVTSCGSFAPVAEQLAAGRRNTEAMLTKVCSLVGKQGPAGPVGDFDFPSIR